VVEIDLSVAGPGGAAWTAAAGEVTFGTLFVDALSQLKTLVLKDNVGITGLPYSLNFLVALTLFDVRSDSESEPVLSLRLPVQVGVKLMPVLASSAESCPSSQ
jgi:hypothetical protein